MKINGNEIRPGHVIEHKNRLWRAVKCVAVKPGKGGAFNQVELKDIQDGTKLNERFRASETVEKARLEQKEYSYLFSQDSTVTFMDEQTYEQIIIDVDLIKQNQSYLQEGLKVEIEFFEDRPIGVNLPEHVICKVVQAESVVKGQTQSSSYKPAVLDNGLRLMVPPHISEGTRIVVNTRDSSYVERAKD